ncbi:hypothetical protein ACVWZV_002498 [Bradyrhizobium sp. GM5.1]
MTTPPIRQFQGAAARNDLAVIQRHRNIAIGRRAQFARKCSVVTRGIGLDMVFGLRNDDAVDQDARNFDVTRIERAGGGDALHLRDDESLAVLGGRCQRQIVEGQRLFFHRDVAVVVGGGTSDDRNVDGKCLVEQPLFAVDFDHPHQLFGGARIQLSATIGRIDEGAEPDLGEKPRPCAPQFHETDAIRIRAASYRPRRDCRPPSGRASEPGRNVRRPGV